MTPKATAEIPSREQAAQEVQDALLAVQKLEDRYLSGDTSVTSTLIQKAREALDFSRLRAKAAEAKIDRDSKEAARIRFNKFQDEYRAERNRLNAGDTEVDQATAAVTAAVTHLILVLTDEAKRHDKLYNTLRDWSGGGFKLDPTLSVGRPISSDPGVGTFFPVVPKYAVFEAITAGVADAESHMRAADRAAQQ